MKKHMNYSLPVIPMNVIEKRTICNKKDLTIE